MVTRAIFGYRWGYRLLGPALIFIVVQAAQSQSLIQGTVYTRRGGEPLRGVSVLGVSGAGTATDSLGHYSIRLASTDSIYYSWLGKATEKFAVRNIPVNESFNLNLDEVNIRSLPALSVNGGRDFFQDSLNTRMQYQKVFGYESKSGPQEKNLNQSGGVGLGWDLNNLVNPSADNHAQALQQRLVDNERDKYIDHRFNRSLVKRITSLEPPALDSFMRVFRPTYEELHGFETEYVYYQWISDAAKSFKEVWGLEYAFRMLSVGSFVWY